jgi:DNA replication protein DnaC
MDNPFLKILRDLAEANGSFPESLSFDVLTPEAYVQMRVDTANAAVGSLAGLDCTICKNRGYITISYGNLNTAVRECGCMTKRRALSRLEKSGLKDMILRYKLEAYKTPNPWQKMAKEMAVSFIENNTGKWFAALGAVGAGKTHICTAICGKLLDAGLDVRYMLWKDEARQLKAAVMDSEEYNVLIGPLQTVKVLYIDDFWKTKRDELSGKYEQPTAADIEIAFKILNARYNDTKLVTIISSERLMADLLSIDEAVGSRIYERSKSYCLDLEGEEKNWRLRP